MWEGNLEIVGKLKSVLIMFYAAKNLNASNIYVTRACMGGGRVSRLLTPNNNNGNFEKAFYIVLFK